jgi:trehalose 6-phosphate phosphatase
MKELLSREHAGVLEPFTSPTALLAFDYDGTLSPLVPQRERAGMRPETIRLFKDVCERFPTVVISGRELDDVAPRLGGAPVQDIVGNHGAEQGNGAGRGSELHASLMQEVQAALRLALAGLPPVDIEDKRISLSVHLPGAEEEMASRLVLTRLTPVVQGFGTALRVVPGHRVVNIVPAEAPTKGDALARLVTARGAAPVLFVGDDVTDEDVFRLQAPWLVGVRVGRSTESAAEYFVRRQLDVDKLLARLLALRSLSAVPSSAPP